MDQDEVNRMLDTAVMLVLPVWVNGEQLTDRETITTLRAVLSDCAEAVSNDYFLSLADVRLVHVVSMMRDMAEEIRGHRDTRRAETSRVHKENARLRRRIARLESKGLSVG